MKLLILRLNIKNYGNDMNLRRISKQELENYLRAPSLFKKKLEIWCKSESNNDAF
ncbi:hypothetical protein [Capnocytophaga gingivalis]